MALVTQEDYRYSASFAWKSNLLILITQKDNLVEKF